MHTLITPRGYIISFISILTRFQCLKLLDLEDMFEGITYCDYAEPQLVCKPHPNMFEKAMREARITDKEKCFFVDDSSRELILPSSYHWMTMKTVNVNAAKEFGWKVCVHLHETEWSGEVITMTMFHG